MRCRPNRSRSHVSTCFVPSSSMRLTPSVNASHCSSSACARAASISSDWLALNSAAASAGDSLDAGRSAPATSATICWTRPVSSSCCWSARSPSSTERAVEPKSATDCPSWRRPAPWNSLPAVWRDGVAGEGRGILPLELPGVVGEQALADQLQQHVVVALERDVHVEVLVQADQAVLGEEAGAAAGLAGLLDRVEGVPGRQRLERGGEGLEVFALLGGVAAAGEDAVELAQQLVVREELRVVLGEQRQQAALVLAVVEQHDLVAAGSGVELAALVRVGEGDVQRERGAGRRGAVERHAALHERAEHREEAAAGGRDVARVRAVGGDVAVAVEEVLARDAHAGRSAAGRCRCR